MKLGGTNLNRSGRKPPLFMRGKTMVKEVEYEYNKKGILPDISDGF